jgi:ferric-dicitrate binding protein FerR (iron transport regulator)
MHEDFKTLFRKWQQGTATEQELTSLIKLFEAGTQREALEEIIASEPQAGLYEDELTEARFMRNFEAVKAQRAALQEQRSPRINIRNLAAVAASLVVIVFVSVWAVKRMDRSELQRMAVTQTSVTDQQFVTLPDGTTVTLNEGSTLTYDSEFGKHTREVVLTGEAYFDVTHQPDKKFIVKTRDVQTTVLGTAFNVKAGVEKIVVTVLRGKVSVGSGDKQFDQIVPNEEITVDSKTLAYTKTSVVAEETVAWKANYLIMDNVTMREAARLISDRFNVQVNLADSSLNDCRIRVHFVKNESLERMLKLVSAAKGGDYAINGKTATISGTCE